MRNIFAVLAFFFLAICSQVALAQQGPFVPLPYDYYETAGRVRVQQNISDLTVSGGGRLFDTPVASADGGPLKVTGTGNIRNPSGNHVPVTATARIPAAQIAGAIGRALGKVLAVVALPIAIIELAQELGFILSKTPDDGSVSVSKRDPTVCTVAPCYDYTYSHMGTYRPTVSSACSAAVAFQNGIANDPYTYRLDYIVESTYRCAVSYRTDSGTSWVSGGFFNLTQRSIAVSAPVYQPSTTQEFLDAVAAKSGWPSSSSAPKALSDSLALAPTPKPVADAPTVSGPATSPGPRVVIQNPTNNTTKTDQTTHHHTYDGPNVTTVTVTNSTTVNNTTGDVIEQATKTEEEKETEVIDFQNSDLPKLPELYKPIYPNGLVGVWSEKKAALLATPLSGVISQLMPSVSGGGSCPAWNLNLDLGYWNYGSSNVAPPCYIWDWCRFFVIAGALLLARALIFGG